MPLSRKRKKKGKKVRGHGARIAVDPNKESAVSLQDLINVLAYQESQKPDDDPTKMRGPQSAEAVLDDIETGKARLKLPEHTVLADDATVTFDKQVPVYVGEGENKRQIGTADPIPGTDNASIHIDDPEILKTIQGPTDHYSIDKEHDE